MWRLVRFVCVVAILIFTVSQTSIAEARWCRRHGVSACCPQRCCGKEPRGTNSTCLLDKLYQIQANDYLYYAYFYEGSCDADPQSVYAEVSVDYGDAPNQRCDHDECILERLSSQPVRAGKLLHYTEIIFPGLDPSLKPDFPTNWAPGITQLGERFETLRILDEGRNIKVRVFDLQLGGTGHRVVHVAFEINHFPTGTTPVPIPLGSGSVKNCQGANAYSLKYHQQKVLLLTAR